MDVLDELRGLSATSHRARRANLLRSIERAILEIVKLRNTTRLNAIEACLEESITFTAIWSAMERQKTFPNNAGADNAEYCVHDALVLLGKHDVAERFKKRPDPTNQPLDAKTRK